MQGSPTNYDAFVCYNDRGPDHDFVLLLISKLEREQGLKLFIPQRDELGGSEADTTAARLIEHRYVLYIYWLFKSLEMTGYLPENTNTDLDSYCCQYWYSMVDINIVSTSSGSVVNNCYMSLVIFALSEQQRHRSACASAQSDQCLCCLLFR